jgi:primosomal replication protein N
MDNSTINGTRGNNAQPNITRSNNSIELIGTLAGAPMFSHSAAEIEYYTFPLEVLRLSGTADVLNIIAPKNVLNENALNAAEEDNNLPERIKVCGEVRTFNNRNGEGAKLIISILAKELVFTSEDERNAAELSGVLCKPPNFRRTPMGREICDLMLAVNRRYGRSDYIPCIAWGRAAVIASEWQVGHRVSLLGRLQSRKYNKLLDSGETIEKTAFEVSITELLNSGA